MECREVLENAVARLAGEDLGALGPEVDGHLEACAACRAERDGLAAAWERLDEAAEPEVTDRFRDRTLGRMEEALRRGKVVPIWRRPVPAVLLRAAALFAAGAVGWALARHPGRTGPEAAAGRTPVVAVASQRTVDASRAALDLAGQTRLSNVSFQPADAAGRIGVSFDVTTRYTVNGRPEDEGVARVLAHLVAANAGSEGTRGRAIDLVAQHYGEKPGASPEVAAMLARTLREDRNPGVRKKAAEALVALPPTAASRDAFSAALKSDPNPAVRILAVEGLAKAASALRDRLSIETLREKAGDEAETGYVRVKAASALREIPL